MTSMRGADVARIDENDKPVSTRRNVEGIESHRAPRLTTQRFHVVADRARPPTVAAGRPAPPDVICRGRRVALPLLALSSTLVARDRLGGPHGARSGVVMRGNVPLT